MTILPREREMLISALYTQNEKRAHQVMHLEELQRILGDSGNRHKAIKAYKQSIVDNEKLARKIQTA